MLHNVGAEVAGWCQTGHINLIRMQWVLQGIRPWPSPRQLAAVAALARLDWPALPPQAAKLLLPD